MRGLQRQGQLPIGCSIERHPEGEEVAHAIGSALCDQSGDDGVDKSRTGGDGVARMAGGMILLRQSCGESALSPSGCGGFAQRRESDQPATPGREAQGQEKPGEAAAADQDVRLSGHDETIWRGKGMTAVRIRK